MTELGNVSKTKVRGILALLKHSDILLPSIKTKSVYDNGDPTTEVGISSECDETSRPINVGNTYLSETSESEEGNPVKLCLNDQVTTIESLRHKHDVSVRL